MYDWTLNGDVARYSQAHMENGAKLYLVSRAITELKLNEKSGSINNYSDPPTLQVRLDSVEEIAAILPVLGRLTKEYHPESKEIHLVGEFKGVKIVFETSLPSTCTVEEVEEDVKVPEKPGIPAVEAGPAHVEKVKKYRMVGDCDPLLAPAPIEEPTNVSAAN